MGMRAEKEFGVTITQGISMDKAKVPDKITGFLIEKSTDENGETPENKIRTNCYYDRDARRYKKSKFYYEMLL